MPDLQNLLDQIDRLDQEATKGPWENMGRTIESNGTYEDVITTEVDCSSYCYGGRGGGVPKDKDAEFIALSRTALPQFAKAVQAVMDCVIDMEEDNGDGSAYSYGVRHMAGTVRHIITDTLRGDDDD